ncbi:tryptophan 7-halogenase [Actinomadura madurae]|uniref:tryptophan 7-halogenase n=1 Tax=Actinomadura madurae TaxID=1993 RepID=UPI0020D257A0|nr:tryptophan 7-halogenase [Actinomadura madurae]
MDERVAFEEFEARYRREYGVFYEFLMSFYDMHVSETSYFWSAKKVTKSTHTELESFVDLIAGVSSGESALADASGVARRFRSRSKEFADAVDEVGRGTRGSMMPLFRASLVREAVREGAVVQTRAHLREEAGAETPMFDSGLVSSADGMFWVRAEET